MASNTRKIALASLFGALIFVCLGFLPSPTSDYLIIVEAFFLALSFLVIGRGGATYVGIVAGLLITLVKLSFFPLDLVFATMFGLLTDACALALKAKAGNKARTGRLVVAVIVSTTITGFIAYYVTAVMTNLVPNEIDLDASILVFGIVSGAIAGGLAGWVWNKYLSSRA